MVDDDVPTVSDPYREDPWLELRRLTPARIGLARAGASLATAPLLEFQLAHARARDAVHAPLDEKRLIDDLAALGAGVLALASAATDRQTYLMRPDLGRMLAPESGSTLTAQGGPFDIVFTISDGLSARAVQTHAAPVLALVLPVLRAEGWRIGPLAMIRHGRVAIGDRVAEALQADSVAMLIGERPGLTAPDSMGAYLTWRPSAQTTDADRNCISNIRPDGIGYADSAFKLLHLLRAMRAAKQSGVRLKDDSDRLLIGDG